MLYIQNLIYFFIFLPHYNQSNYVINIYVCACIYLYNILRSPILIHYWMRKHEKTSVKKVQFFFIDDIYHNL